MWTAVSRGKHWKNTLLVITYDEHGGCFDHVKPPDTAIKPDKSKPQ
jgi:phospholipase C